MAAPPGRRNLHRARRRSLGDCRLADLLWYALKSRPSQQPFRLTLPTKRSEKNDHVRIYLQRKPAMEQAIENFLNTLSEAERAGGRVLHELVSLAQSAELRELLKKVGH